MLPAPSIRSPRGWGGRETVLNRQTSWSDRTKDCWRCSEWPRPATGMLCDLGLVPPGPPLKWSLGSPRRYACAIAWCPHIIPCRWPHCCPVSPAWSTDEPPGTAAVLRTVSLINSETVTSVLELATVCLCLDKDRTSDQDVPGVTGVEPGSGCLSVWRGLGSPPGSEGSRAVSWPLSPAARRCEGPAVFMAGAEGGQQNGTEAEGLASTHTQNLTKLNLFCSAKSNPVPSVKVSGFTPAPRYQANIPCATQNRG